MVFNFDVAGGAPTLPEFWYRQRSLCPKGLPMSVYAIELRESYATKLREFMRCYTALLNILFQILFNPRF